MPPFHQVCNFVLGLLKNRDMAEQVQKMTLILDKLFVDGQVA
jgi:hypothetical protein